MNQAESILGQTYFWCCFALAVAGALGTVASKNPIRSAMGLLLVILGTAGLFLSLHAEFLAAIQLIVYAGAITVLFIFVIMLLGPDASTPTDHRGRIPRIGAAVVFAAGGLGAMYLLLKTAPPEVKPLPAVAPDFGGVNAFGSMLFTRGLLPFELSSALLMVAIVGALAVARGRGKSQAQKAVEETPLAQAPARKMEPEAYP